MKHDKHGLLAHRGFTILRSSWIFRDVGKESRLGNSPDRGGVVESRVRVDMTPTKLFRVSISGGVLCAIAPPFRPYMELVNLRQRYW